MLMRTEVLQAVQSAEVKAWRSGLESSHSDSLAEERAVALVLNGINYAVMMTSPSDLEDFALGFALTEGLLQSKAELFGIDVVYHDAGIELQMQVASRVEQGLKERKRAMAGRTGCGICGVESLQQVARSLPQVASAVRLQPARIGQAVQQMRSQQVLQNLTGATHAAALCTADGEIVLLREDVGRHNALDKLIGAMQRETLRTDTDRFICITSRASFEMVQKTAMAGVGVLVAVSAPTQLAVETAKHCGMALAGFVRNADFVAYTRAETFGLN